MLDNALYEVKLLYSLSSLLASFVWQKLGFETTMLTWDFDFSVSFLLRFIDSISRLKINDNRDRDAAAQSTPFPDRPGEPDCLYYLRTGSCGYGSNCRYNHPAHVSLVMKLFHLFTCHNFCFSYWWRIAFLLM